MDNNHLINADPRPKRRRKKDNPYVLFTIGINTDHPQYYVRFKDRQNHLHCEEISRELYEQLDDYELEDLSEMNENDRHIEQSEVSENSLHRRAAEPMEPTHEVAEKTMYSEYVHKAVEMLPPIQRRRVKLYYFVGLTLEQIGSMENCTKQAVKATLRTAEKNLEIILKKLL